MSPPGNTRRLAAVVAADVAGFSRLMGLDEEGTLAALTAHRTELIEPAVAAHRGRIVKTTGDGFLVEYQSVVDALKSWLEIQAGMAERNEAEPEDRRIQLRVGVNVGDIIEQAGDIFGDGVNIAARLEAIAAPGGICASAAVVDQVEKKLDVSFDDLGERSLKNIERPVRAYRIAHASVQAGPAPAPRAGGAKDAAIFFPERPSIAILPFRDLSANPEDDFIADGISLGIQTLMVQLPGLFLINAVAHQGYRDRKCSAAEAVKDLPIRYVLEGTVQRAGQRVRVLAQLTDLRENTVIWADRYDRELEDVFALQDDITREIIAALNITLIRDDFDRVLTADMAGGEVWEIFLRGVSHIYKFTKNDNQKARQMFERLHELRPDKVFGSGYTSLTHWLDLSRGWSDNPARSRAEAERWAEIAMPYEDNDGLGHVVMGSLKLFDGAHEEALELCETALSYRSNCPAALGQTAAVQLYAGMPEKAVRNARESLAVRPMYPPLIVNLLASAYRDAGDLDMSIAAAQEAARIDDAHVDGLVTLCSDYAIAGRLDEARRVAGKVLEREPRFTVSGFAAQQPYRDVSKREALAKALVEAGLPA